MAENLNPNYCFLCKHLSYFPHRFGVPISSEAKRLHKLMLSEVTG